MSGFGSKEALEKAQRDVEEVNSKLITITRLKNDAEIKIKTLSGT